MARPLSILAASGLVLTALAGPAGVLVLDAAWADHATAAARLLDDSRSLDAALRELEAGSTEEARAQLTDLIEAAPAGVRPVLSGLARCAKAPRCLRVEGHARRDDVRAAFATELRAVRERRDEQRTLAFALFVLAGVAGLVAVAWLAWRHPRREGRSPITHSGAAPQGSVADLEGLLQARLEELYALRRRTMESDRFVALGEVAAGLSHGLKTPLATLRARVQIAMTRLDDAHPAQADLDEAVAQVDRLIDDIRGFLRASDTGGLVPSRVEASRVLEVLARGCASLAGEAGVRLEVEVLDDAPAMVVDASLLEIALRNLVENAVQASPRGGQVRLGARRAPPPARAGVDRAAVPAGGEWMELWVEDGAGGLPPDVLLGQRRGSEKPAGSGLGFAVARRIVERHGGALEAEDMGAGTRMRLRLPVEGSAIGLVGGPRAPGPRASGEVVP